ncbi:hypothetical protein VTH06DRAFT_630 [Thermothelomyces fergusii]
MPLERFDYFFDFPLEIREHILSYFCLFPTGIWVGGGAGGKSIALSPAAAALLAGKSAVGGGGGGGAYALGDCSADPPINLFLASPLLYREAGDLYYGRNVFHFAFSLCSWGRKKAQQPQGGHGLDKERATTQQEQRRGEGPISAAAAARHAPHDPSAAALARFLTHADTARARRRVRSAVVHLRRLGGLVEDVVVPALADLALAGRLRRLRVHIGGEHFLCLGRSLDVLSFVVDGDERPYRPHQHPGGAGGDHDRALADNPALRALLVLLADPSLEKSELRVLWPHHDRFWCGFHASGGRSGEGGCRCAVPGRRPSSSTLAEVDIPRLVDAVAGNAAAEFNIKKIG